MYFAASILIYFMFFFCKQKTAYELRISDWSSDVCSSDLPVDIILPILPRRVQRHVDAHGSFDQTRPDRLHHAFILRLDQRAEFRDAPRIARGEIVAFGRVGGKVIEARLFGALRHLQFPVARTHRAIIAREPEHRSEEHTSELQSLMRITYA